MSNKLIRVLCIDGGGVRGIIPGEILIALEEKLQQRSGKPDAKIADYFDLLVGTSTGGILTCLFLCPEKNHPHKARYTAKEVTSLLREHGGAIFNIPLWQKIRSLGGLANERYPVEPLIRVLKRYLGKIRLSELVKPCLITTYDMQKRRTYFFSRHKATLDKKHDFYARDVARATSAAPTFFEVASLRSLGKVRHSMIDGGLFASNPAMCAYAELNKSSARPTAKKMIFVSLGVGQINTPYDYRKVKHWGIFDWLNPLLDIFMSGEAETVDYQLRQIFAAEEAGKQYFRFNPELDSKCSPDMDNACEENLCHLQMAGIRAAQEYRTELDRLAGLLILQSLHPSGKPQG